MEQFDFIGTFFIPSIMSQAADVKKARYSLRPKPSAFDLLINNNRYGLKRRTIDRATHRVPKRIEIKSRIKIVKQNTTNASDLCFLPVPASKIPLVTTSDNTWTLPKPTLEMYSRKPTPNLYDVSAAANFMDLNEECIFEVFNHLSLTELCIVAGVCSQLRFAAQKYFDVMYTAVNLAWLNDDDTGTYTLLQAKRLLYNFGHLISTLVVNTDLMITESQEDGDCKEKLLLLVQKYCAGFVFWNTKK